MSHDSRADGAAQYAYSLPILTREKIFHFFFENFVKRAQSGVVSIIIPPQ